MDNLEKQKKKQYPEYAKEYRLKNKEKIKERRQQYIEANKEKVLERYREYYYKNRERIVENTRKRRLRLNSNNIETKQKENKPTQAKEKPEKKTNFLDKYENKPIKEKTSKTVIMYDLTVFIPISMERIDYLTRKKNIVDFLIENNNSKKGNIILTF